MERTVFLQHYRLCTNHDGSPQGVGRSGAATSYKAIDTRSNQPVQLQLVPFAMIDEAKRNQFKERAETAQRLDHINIAKVIRVDVEHDYLVLVSQYLEGETADNWIVAHGPMSAHAVLRVGLQVVRAIKAAAFLNLTHRAIQPSSLAVMPDKSPDGGWPLIKVLNFGLAGIELHSDSAKGSELAPSISPQFASPEQLLNRRIDFRSELYSLGATMCFLLTGATPLPVSGMKTRLQLRRLPELRRAPKVLHKVLVHLLREDPEKRPQDPVAFEQELRETLAQLELRQAMTGKLRTALRALMSNRFAETREPSAPIFRRVVASAVVVLVGVAIGAILFAGKTRLFHRDEQAGVAIGVPNADAYATKPVGAPTQAPTAAPAAAIQSNENASVAVAAPTQASPTVSPSQAASSTSAQPATVEPQSESTEAASAVEIRKAEPVAPEPNVESSSAETSERSTSADTGGSSSRSERKSGEAASARQTSLRDAASDHPSADHEQIAPKPTIEDRDSGSSVRRTTEPETIVQPPPEQAVVAKPVAADDVSVASPSPTPQRKIYFQRPGSFIPVPKPTHTPKPPSDD